MMDFEGEFSASLAAQRLDNFYTWLSNTRPTEGQELNTATCTLCLQFSGRVQANIPAVVNCPIVLASFRYFIVQSSIITLPICFCEVQVFVCKLKRVFSSRVPVTVSKALIFLPDKIDPRQHEHNIYRPQT
jgi:hypothetical protein